MATTSTTGVVDAHDGSPLFGRLLVELPDVVRYEILSRLDPTSRALLRRAGRGCRAAVEAAVSLPRAGSGVSRFTRGDFEGTAALLAWAKANGCPWDWLGDFLQERAVLFAAEVLWRLDPIDRTFLAQAGRLCRAVVLGSDLPRAGTDGSVTHKLSARGFGVFIGGDHRNRALPFRWSWRVAGWQVDKENTFLGFGVFVIRADVT